MSVQEGEAREAEVAIFLTLSFTHFLCSGSFALFVSPPQAPSRVASGLPVFPRRIVFVIDNSGSMSGMPLTVAKQALEGVCVCVTRTVHVPHFLALTNAAEHTGCLNMLRPEDSFAICVFNHEIEWWLPDEGASGPHGEHGKAMTVGYENGM